MRCTPASVGEGGPPRGPLRVLRHGDDKRGHDHVGRGKSKPPEVQVQRVANIRGKSMPCDVA
jgi:hypothetical protein